MNVDPVQLAQDLTPYVTSAITAYGAAVLARVESEAADASVSFGRNVVRRLTGRETPGRETNAGQETLAEIVSELAASPDDGDLATALRVQIRRLLAAHPDVASEIAEWARPVAPATVNVTTSGERSPAVYTNYGTIHTGDSPTT